MARVPTLTDLKEEARRFAVEESAHDEPTLFGVTDGKAVGTYLEQKFQRYLKRNYDLTVGSAARGIDFPQLNVDVKTTSIRQPQSSCPFKSARQKVYGLGYHLLVFVYDKTDDMHTRSSTLRILHTVFVDSSRTADYQTTRTLNEILSRDGNAEDISAFLLDRNLPLDEILAQTLSDEILRNPPTQGYLTISNALQWRLQYGRVIQQAGLVAGVEKL